VFIRTALCLWLLYYAALHLAVLLRGQFEPFGQNRKEWGRGRIVPILGFGIFLVAFFVQVVYVYLI
jgi:hypothetical protein